MNRIVAAEALDHLAPGNPAARRSRRDLVRAHRAMGTRFGACGIGSLRYLMFASWHGLPEPLALQLIQLTLIVVTLSILMHGISVKPLMAAVWRRT